MRRVSFTVLSVVLAAAVAVATNVFTEQWQWTWGAGLAALVALLAVVQVGLFRSEQGGAATRDPSASVTVVGDRSVGWVQGSTVVSGDQNVVTQPRPQDEAESAGEVHSPKDARR